MARDEEGKARVCIAERVGGNERQDGPRATKSTRIRVRAPCSFFSLSRRFSEDSRKTWSRTSGRSPYTSALAPGSQNHLYPLGVRHLPLYLVPKILFPVLSPFPSHSSLVHCRPWLPFMYLRLRLHVHLFASYNMYRCKNAEVKGKI